LDEKYGFGERVPFTNIVIYSTYINGKKVEIYLDLAEVFAQYLKITYVYSCMDNLVKNEIERRKAQRVNNEL
ncbi:MAG: hypothetical protein GXO57_09075, partial [Thermodesulfobacteria bacterium]|nr:hypothetical protein [Thermodesulfobacteriota bacterium]